MSRAYVLRIPERRYAIFNDPLRGDYAIVVRGDDMRTAQLWGGFVGWLGGVRPATTRVVTDRMTLTTTPESN